MSDTPLSKRMGRPIRKSGEAATKDRILDAAIYLFSERGYERTSIRQIAQAVDLTEGALYRHFPGKEDLLSAIITQVEQMVTQPLPGLEFGESSKKSVFRILFESPADAFEKYPMALRMCRIFFTESPHNEQIRTYLKYAMEEMADIEVSRILDEQIGLGAVRPCNTRTVAQLVNVIRFQWCYQVAILDRDEDYDINRYKLGLEPIINYFEGLYTNFSYENEEQLEHAYITLGEDK